MARTATKSRKTTKSRKPIKTIGEEYPDTQGMDLPEASDKLTTKQQAKKDAAHIKRYFQGQIPATKVFNRKMKGFSPKQGNKCHALTWLLLDEKAGTVCFGNTYNEDMLLNASFNPDVYTTPYKSKVHDPKMESMTEIDADEWPQWVTSARRRATK